MPLADRAIRWTLTAAVTLLASISFVVSYQHTYALAVRLGEQRQTARLIPLTLDLLLIASAMTGLFCSRYGLPQPRLARLALLLGIVATICVNVAEGIARGPWAALFAGWPAVALVVSAELLLWLVAASRSLDNRAVVVIEQTEPEQASKLREAVALLGSDPRMSGAELGRRMGLKYDDARVLVKEARALMAG